MIYLRFRCSNSAEPGTAKLRHVLTGGCRQSGPADPGSHHHGLHRCLSTTTEHGPPALRLLPPLPTTHYTRPRSTDGTCRYTPPGTVTPTVPGLLDHHGFWMVTTSPFPHFVPGPADFHRWTPYRFPCRRSLFCHHRHLPLRRWFGLVPHPTYSYYHLRTRTYRWPFPMLLTWWHHTVVSRTDAPVTSYNGPPGLPVDHFTHERRGGQLPGSHG